jgi:two-component system OmpR family response regulator
VIFVADRRPRVRLTKPIASTRVVLNIMLPGDDGLMLCRELQAGEHKSCESDNAMEALPFCDSNRAIGPGSSKQENQPRVVVATSMLALMAFEYGQMQWVVSTSFWLLVPASPANKRPVPR